MRQLGDRTYSCKAQPRDANEEEKSKSVSDSRERRIPTVTSWMLESSVTISFDQVVPVVEYAVSKKEKPWHIS
jgi:hypothetical protein